MQDTKEQHGTEFLKTGDAATRLRRVEVKNDNFWK